MSRTIDSWRFRGVQGGARNALPVAQAHLRVPVRGQQGSLRTHVCVCCSQAACTFAVRNWQGSCHVCWEEVATRLVVLGVSRLSGSCLVALPVNEFALYSLVAV